MDVHFLVLSCSFLIYSFCGFFLRPRANVEFAARGRKMPDRLMKVFSKPLNFS